MNRADLKVVAATRLKEAKTLLDAGFYSGSFYLAGYAVECALKACIARQVRKGDFPDKKLAKAFTHDLDILVNLAGLRITFEGDRAVNQALDVNWATVKNWTVERRYDVSVTEAEARDLYAASAGRYGVVPWLRRRW